MAKDLESSRAYLPIAALGMALTTTMMLLEVTFVTLKEFQFTDEEDDPRNV